MCARAHPLYGWADNVQIWYVVGDGSTDRFPQIIRGTLALSAHAMRTRSSIASKASYWLLMFLHIFHVRVQCTVGLVGLPCWLVWCFEGRNDNVVGSLSFKEALYDNY